MNNSQFSTLIYRIIGKPDRWHDDYIDVMHQVLDETESFDDPVNFSELEAGGQILRQMEGANNAVTALDSFLNHSRFKVIILNEKTEPIYHNQNAAEFYKESLASHDSSEAFLKPSLKKLVNDAIKENEGSENLIALNARDQNGEQVYLRKMNSPSNSAKNNPVFYVLTIIDRFQDQGSLNQGFVKQYDLSEKEQNVLVKLMRGCTVKQAASELFVSDNTIRSHLKSLFRKTGSNSQSDLIRLVLTHESQVFDSYFDTTSRFVTTSQDTQDKSITLESGLTISYREYGPENGTPIIVCHNGYGCRVMVPDSYLIVLERENKRLIIPDRSGTGQSPFVKGGADQRVSELREFIDLLNLPKYEIMGSVLGCVYALLHAVDADARLTRLHLASPVFVNRSGDMNYLIGIFAPAVRLVRASKRFAREIYELWLKSVSMKLETNYRTMVEKSWGSVEREALQDSHLLDYMTDHLVECFREACSQTTKGISTDMVYCLTPKKIDLRKISVPVEIWWGTEDARISRDGVDNLVSQLDQVNLHIREGYSEHIYYGLFDEIMAN